MGLRHPNSDRNHQRTPFRLLLGKDHDPSSSKRAKDAHFKDILMDMESSPNNAGNCRRTLSERVDLFSSPPNFQNSARNYQTTPDGGVLQHLKLY